MRRSMRIAAVGGGGGSLRALATTETIRPHAASGSNAARTGSGGHADAVVLQPQGDGEAPWRRLCGRRELSCTVTLTSGQVFTWQQEPVTAHWLGVVGQSVFRLRERGDAVEFQCVHPRDVPPQTAYEKLHDYFRLEVDAVRLYEAWSKPDDAMATVIRSLPGLRIIRQDPVECLFAFICSSNNNIQRITKMVTALKTEYGKLLCGDPAKSTAVHAFPTVDALAKRADEDRLRELGFGYRAPFIIKTSRQLRELGGLAYLQQLRDEADASTRDRDAYAAQLMVFAGVGRKVADCVGLFALNKLHAIPVDTHVWQIACREFDSSLEARKSLTPKVYQAVGDHFRTRFPDMAGWAHSVLFAGDLTAFRAKLPVETRKRSAHSDGDVATSTVARKTTKTTTRVPAKRKSRP